MQRLDKELVARGLVQSRSQAENMIQLGLVKLGGEVVTRPAELVGPADKITLDHARQYVSRAALKLESADRHFKLPFPGSVVLDVGSSTGGFTDYALRHGAKRVVAVDTGTNQLHPSLRADERILLLEQTDIRDLRLAGKSARSGSPKRRVLPESPDIVVIDVSFISLREVLPHITKLAGPNTQILAMCKPQFEAGSRLKNKGVIKNDTMRRQVLKDFEAWAKTYFVVTDKFDSEVSGKKGNQERFYLLKLAK